MTATGGPDEGVDPDAHVKGPGQEWRAGLKPEHEEMLSAWENHPAAVGTGRARSRFRDLIGTAPPVEGPVYRGDNVKDSYGYKSRIEAKLPVGGTVHFPRWSSTTARPEVAGGFGHVVYEIHGHNARGIGNTLHEAVMPPGKYKIHSTEWRTSPTRAIIDGRTMSDSEHLHVLLHPAETERTAVRYSGREVTHDDGRAIGPDDELTLYHETSAERAAHLRQHGTSQTKPVGARTVDNDYEPGRGMGKGLYLMHTPHAAGGVFGDTVLPVRVRAGDLAVPPERAHRIPHGMTPLRSLMVGDGYTEAELSHHAFGEPIRRQASSSRGDRSTCPCGTPVEFDSIDGWQHADGSVSHDGQFHGKTVSDLMHTAAWEDRSGDAETMRVKPVRAAGFKGYVGTDYYGDEEESDEDEPDHLDEHLHHFVRAHGADAEDWKSHAPQPQRIDLRAGVYATQSHVSQQHIDKYLVDPGAQTHKRNPRSKYLGDEHAMFVTHNGNLHATDGHHRVAAALQRGDTHIMGWHHDLDAHPVGSQPVYSNNGMGVVGRKSCEECQGHAGQHTAAARAGYTSAGQRNWGTFWHGTPSGDLRGGSYGLHVGSQEAARQALEARIGFRADGKDWDGTQEYGKTQLAGRRNLLGRERGQHLLTGHNSRGLPEHDHYPHERAEKPKFGSGDEVQPHHRPALFPVRITGEMSNTPESAHDDFKANGLMKGQITRGNARRGYFYRNQGEDDGSISAVLPGPGHVERADHRAGSRIEAAWEKPGDVMTRMHPRDLMPHVGDFDLDHNLIDSMRQHGWDPDKGKAFLRQRGQPHEDDKPVTLWHTDQGSYVEPGNHRVPAADAAGLDSIPVLVKDRRTTTQHMAAWTPPPTRLPNGDHVGSYGDAGSGGQYNEVLGAHHGETGEYSGHLAVNSLGTEHHVQFMETPEHLRGRGTMTGLVEHYKKHVMQPGDTLHWGMTTPEGDAWIAKHGARFTPDKRVFTHTDGLDHRLFDGEHLRPEVRSDVLARFTRFCAIRGYRNWSSWGRLVFFGSEASEWTSLSLEGNGDFDLSLGVDYLTFRQHNPAYETMTDQEIAQMFTQQMHADLNDPEHYFMVAL